jgi:hypothetical protein
MLCAFRQRVAKVHVRARRFAMRYEASRRLSVCLSACQSAVFVALRVERCVGGGDLMPECALSLKCLPSRPRIRRGIRLAALSPLVVARRGLRSAPSQCRRHLRAVSPRMTFYATTQARLVFDCVCFGPFFFLLPALLPSPINQLRLIRCFVLGAQRTHGNMVLACLAQVPQSNGYTVRVQALCGQAGQGA